MHASSLTLHWARRLCALALAIVVCTRISAAMEMASSTSQAAEGGVSVMWLFANLSYTGMRAQAKGTAFWRIVTFILGFPATLLTLLVVTRGSERAYGIDMPRKS